MMRRGPGLRWRRGLLLLTPAYAAAKKPAAPKPKPVLSAFQQEEAMSPAS